MGLFAAIGGAIVAGVSAVGTLVSGACSFVAGVAGKVGSVISGFARKAVEVVAGIPKIDANGVEKAFDFAGKMISVTNECLGIKSEDEPEVLGAKTVEAEKRITDFDGDVEAYIKYLNKEIKLDEVKFNEMSQEEKLGCKAVGTALEIRAIEDKIGGIEIPPETIALLAKIMIKNSDFGLSGEQIVGFIKGLKAAGITDFKDIVDLLEGKHQKGMLKTENALEKALGDMEGIENPGEEIKKVKRMVREFE